MIFSIVILIIAVAVVFGFWLRALSFAARRERPSDFTFRNKLVAKGALLFVGLVVVNLLVGASGVATRFDRFPPPFAFFFIFNVFLVPSFIAFSRFGSLIARHISNRALVGFQSFRILAELLIFAAVHEGIAPIQMSFEGYNPDILTAVFAIALFFALRRQPHPRLALLFNLWGIFALIVIGFIAITSMPTPLRLFPGEPSNIWVATAPYTLLPGILVAAAVAGHLIFFRKRALARQRALQE